MLRACVVPKCTDVLGILTLTPIARLEKLETAEHNWVRRICRVKRNVVVKMKEFREEIGMKTFLMRKVFGSGTRWTGYAQRLGDETVLKRNVSRREERYMKNGMTKGQMGRQPGNMSKEGCHK